MSVADAVETTAVPEGERKTVTALFADIKGSMELMEDLDPEEARAIVDPALNLMMDAVHRYDGYIVQSTGDGIFALFGAPIAHEDHPQRALYSALRMQEDVKRYAEKLRAEKGVNLQVRVGVNTGEVVVRSIKTDEAHTEYTPIGHSTSLASRLQALAASGSIAISETLRKLVEGYFALKPLGPARVKGVSKPVNVYEVTGLGPLRTRLQRAVGRGLTKFVGREREMEVLKHAAELAKQGHGQIVAAIAEPGVGKSRLLYEFKAVAQSGWMVLETFSVSHGKASAYLPVLDLLHGYFRITWDDDARIRREKVTGRLFALDRTLEDALPYLLGLLGLVEGEDPLAQMDAQVKKRRTLEAIKRILMRESLNQPLMVIFEDLHWIDEETQALLNLLVDGVATSRILMLVNYRPEYTHQWGNRTYYTQLRLDPLGRESAEEMLDGLLTPSPPPSQGDGRGVGIEALKRLIIERSEGNPFFMEEIVQALFEQGALQRNGTVTPVRESTELKIPPTVQAILAGRIDRLSPAEKELLQTLAVIGKGFPLGLVRETVARPDEELERLLRNLQLGEFIYEQPAFPEPEYTFKHALTQEVAYNSVLTARRRMLHGRIGVALEKLHADRLEDHLPELGHHYSRSGNIAKAVHYLKLAAEQAGRRSAYEDALDSLMAAIGLLPGMPESRERDLLELELRVAHGPLYAAVRGFATPEMEPHVRRLQELCQRVGESPAIIGVLFALWSLSLARARLDEAMPLATQLIKLAAPLDDPFAVGGAHAAMGVTSMWLGKFRSAREHLEQTVAIFDPDLARYLPMQNASVIPTRCQLAWTLWMLGYPDQASRTMSRALALADQLKRPFNTAFALQYAVALEDFQRDHRLIKPKIESLIEISRENGFTACIDSANLSLGRALVFKGNHEGGIAMMLDALAGMREHGNGSAETFSLPLMADSFLRSNQIDQGLEVIKKAFASFDATGARIQEAEAHRLKGELLLLRPGAEADAADSFRRAVEIARQQQAKSWELRATTSLARLLRKQGKSDEARKMLAEIYNWFTEGFEFADLKDAEALLDELRA
ncbi:MAG: adenylate/guanylate cyclase domain-containing protein [Candidatus Binataceae bacterium]